MPRRAAFAGDTLRRDLHPDLRADFRPRQQIATDIGERQ